MNIAFLMVLEWLLTYIKLFSIHCVSCGGAVKVDGGRGLEMFLNSSHPMIYLIHLCRHWGNLFGGIGSGI